jgi:hypothetical protein
MNDTLVVEGAGHLTEQHVDLARTFVADLMPAGVRPRLAFVSGSLAAGLGHTMSDIDVHILPPEGVPLRFHSVNTPLGMVQANPLSEQDARNLVEMTSEYRVTPRQRDQIAVSDPALRDLVRFAIGTVLDSEFPVAEAAVRRDVARKIIISRGANHLSSYAEDSYGALRSGDLLTALSAAEIAVRHGAEVLLAAIGDLYVGPKFLYRRLHRHRATAPLLDEILAELAAVSTSDVSASTAERHVTRRLRASATWVTAAAMHAWDRPWPEDREPLRFGGTPVRGGYVRSPWFVPVRYGDSWSLAGPDLGLRVTVQVIAAWLACDGSTAEGVRDHLAGSFPGQEPPTRDTVDAVLAKLASFEAITGGAAA